MRSLHFDRDFRRDLLADHNPTVVANAVASLVEISDRSDDISLRLNATVAGKLVAALGECSEWVLSPKLVRNR
jgi:AP-2 complex subunit beta-1